jgi:TonB family protein
MAFRALLFSKSPETDTAMTAACKTTGIRAVVCSDIFTAIEKAKAQAFSCVIANWADQPEASFLLKRARESTPNRNTVAIAIVDHDPSPVEMRENRLDFLIYRPISSVEAEEVLAKASEQMKPLSAEDAAESSGDGDPSGENSASDATNGATQHNDEDQGDGFAQESADQAGGDSEIATAEDEDLGEPGARSRNHALWFRKACAAILVLIAAFYLWRSRDVIEYLAHTREGRVQIFRESVEALFYLNQNGALPAGGAQQDAYFSREPASPDAKTPDLGVVPTESTLTESHPTLPQAPDFPLPAPVLDRQEPPPIHRARAAIPESMRESPPIERPVVVTVNPAQMMPVSAPQPQPASQSFSEPVAVSEEAARSLLIQSVDPVYPPEAAAQKLHGAVVLQAVIGRDGSVEDLKIVQGYFALGRAAIAAVKQWRFQPYNVGGHAAATATTITINFSAPPA